MLFKKIIKFFTPGVRCQYGRYGLPVVTSTPPMPKCKPPPLRNQWDCGSTSRLPCQAESCLSCDSKARYRPRRTEDVTVEKFKSWFEGYSAGVELPAILIEKVKNLRNPITLKS